MGGKPQKQSHRQLLKPKCGGKTVNYVLGAGVFDPLKWPEGGAFERHFWPEGKYKQPKLEEFQCPEGLPQRGRLKYRFFGTLF